MSKDVLKELKSGFTQFLYAYYEELNKKYSQENAKKLTYEVVSELTEPFLAEKIGSISYYSLMKDWEKEWLVKEKEAIKTNDYDLREEATEVLMGLKLLLPYAKEKDKEKDR